jgi:hypothetical protein
MAAPCGKLDTAFVLKVGFTVFVFSACAVLLLRFACLLAAEQKLLAAAQAGVTEATLPKATSVSVHNAVERRLAMLGHETIRPQIWLERNEEPVIGHIYQQNGDRFRLFVSMPARAVLPEWLVGGDTSLLQVCTERIMGVSP